MKKINISDADSVESAMVAYGVACRFIALKFRLKDEIERLKQFRRWLAQDFKCEKQYPERCWSLRLGWEGDPTRYTPDFENTRNWCDACRKTHKISMRIKRLSRKAAAIDLKLVRILGIKRNRVSCWNNVDYYPEKRNIGHREVCPRTRNECSFWNLHGDAICYYQDQLCGVVYAKCYQEPDMNEVSKTMDAEHKAGINI